MRSVNCIFLKKLFILGFLVLVLSFQYSAEAQNGKLISKKEFKAPSKLIKSLNEDEAGSNYADTFALAKMYSFAYRSDTYEVKGYMVVPAKAGKYPVLIYNRDGQLETGLLNEMVICKELHEMARWGYVVVASQYRGNAGGEGKDELGGDDVNDILNLIPFLSNIPEADTSRIGMYGINRGGMMTYIALKYTSVIDAAIVESGISNLFMYAAEHNDDGYYDILAQMIPGYYADKLTPFKKRSVVYWPDEVCKTTPLLIMQGSSDKQVHPSESMRAVEKLFKVLHPVRFILFEGGNNGLSNHRKEKYYEIRNWLDKYVRDQEKFPPILNLEK